MDHRPKYETQNYRLLKDNIGENLEDPGYGHDLLTVTYRPDP